MESKAGMQNQRLPKNNNKKPKTKTNKCVPDQNLIHSIQQDLLLRDTQCQS
jgi:hypothetical protein